MGSALEGLPQKGSPLQFQDSCKVKCSASRSPFVSQSTPRITSRNVIPGVDLPISHSKYIHASACECQKNRPNKHVGGGAQFVQHWHSPVNRRVLWPELLLRIRSPLEVLGELIKKILIMSKCPLIRLTEGS